MDKLVNKTYFPCVNVSTTFSIQAIASLVSYDYTPSFAFSGEFHDEWELVYVNMGEVTILAGEQSFVVPSRHYFLHSPCEPHAIRANNCNCNVLICSFKLGKEKTALFPLCQKVNKASENQFPLLSGIMNEYHSNFETFNFFEADAPYSLSPQMTISLHAVRNYLEIFFLYALHTAAPAATDEKPENNVGTLQNEIVSAITLYLNQHLEHHISLEDLASHIGYSQSYLSKTFRRTMGMSITEHLIQQRISRAKFLMTNHALPFSDIAAQTGFGSLQSFSKMFKLKTGYSPSEYRKSLEIHQRYNFLKR